MNLEQIKTFIMVYRSGSFHKAAELLFIPQPTVSHRIHQLEKSLGKKLIHRRKNGNQLTLEGQAFYPYALQILENLEQGQVAVEKAAKQEEALLEIGSTNSLSNMFLFGILKDFIDRFPQTRIRVHSYSTGEVIQAIRRGTFNVGLCRYSVDDSELTFRLVNSEHIFFIVSKDHPWSGYSTVTLEEISRHPLIVYQEGMQYREIIDFVFKQKRLSCQMIYEMNNLELIKQMVADGYGATLFAPSYMGNEISRGALVAIPIEHNPFPMRQTFLVCQKEKMNRVDKMFYDHVLACTSPH